MTIKELLVEIGSIKIEDIISTIGMFLFTGVVALVLVLLYYKIFDKRHRVDMLDEIDKDSPLYNLYKKEVDETN